MIRTTTEQGRLGEDIAYIVHFQTPISEGSQRFGGYNARAKATTFAVSKLQELLAKD